MSLLDVQNFLARIYTDENLRREFFIAPEKTGKENSLTEKEIVELTEILPEELNFFAESLLRKRLREVEKLLPLTRRILAEAFEKHFRDFACQFTPDSIKKHLEDAIRFCIFLQSKNITPIWAKDAVKFEQAKIEFYGGKNLILRIFDYDLKEISRQDLKTPVDFKKRKTFALWLRIGKRTRHFVW